MNPQFPLAAGASTPVTFPATAATTMETATSPSNNMNISTRIHRLGTVTRHRRLVRRQTAAMNASIQLMNQGVRLFSEGRDSRAIVMLRKALDAIDQCPRQPSCLDDPVASGVHSDGDNGSCSSSSSGVMADTAQRLGQLRAHQAKLYAYQEAQPPSQTGNNSADPIDAETVAGAATAGECVTPPVQSPTLRHESDPAPTAAEIPYQTVAWSASPTPVSQGQRSEHSGREECWDQDDSEDDDDDDEAIVFEGIHIPVPISKIAQPTYPPNSHGREQQEQSSSFTVHNDALLLSMDEIALARNYHRLVRQVEHECRCDYNDTSREDYDCDLDCDCEDEAASARAREVINSAIESEFVDLVRPLVHSCILYNIALLFDVQARCLPPMWRPAASVDGRACSSSRNRSSQDDDPEEDERRRVYFAKKAYIMYGNAARTLRQRQWESFGTAMLIRIAAVNNRTVLLAEQRVGVVDSRRLHDTIERTSHFLLDMIRYSDQRFHPATSNPDIFFVRMGDGAGYGGTRAADLDAIRWNICLWRVRSACNEFGMLPKSAPAA